MPDSLTVMRDPEIELPEDEDSTEVELENKLTAIKLDRMHDGSQTEESEEEIAPLRRSTRKRKYIPADGESQEEQRRKRTASPRTFSPTRGND